jgi:hypothetical protein
VPKEFSIMSCIEITNVQVFNNPAKFVDPFQFEITFECIHPLEEDLDWTLQYVACPSNAAQDLTLESVSVGPVHVGVNKFILQADAPDVKLIPRDDLLGVTVLLIKCEYRNQEFVRVGYYVSNEYETEDLRLNPPDPPQPTRIVRNILADKPRVTKFNIDWTAAPKSTQSQALPFSLNSCPSAVTFLPTLAAASTTSPSSALLSTLTPSPPPFNAQTSATPFTSPLQALSVTESPRREVLNNNSNSEHSSSGLMESMPLTLCQGRLVDLSTQHGVVNALTPEPDTAVDLRPQALLKVASHTPHPSSQSPQPLTTSE